MASPVSIIIQREFMERVGKKSFIITTLLMPVLMLLLMAAPSLVMLYSTPENRSILVIDNTNVILPKLESGETLKFSPTSQPVDSALAQEGVDGVLVIPADIVKGEGTLIYHSNGPSSLDVESTITNQVNTILHDYKLASYQIEGLQKILEDSKTNVGIRSLRADKDSSETSSMLSAGLGMVLTFMLYMFMILYGQMVMTSVIEEKNNRVLEIVVSSVKPTQLMLGKICGICLVAVTQILIWGILISCLSAFVLPALLPEQVATDMAALNAGASVTALNTDADILSAMAMLGDVYYIIKLFGLMVLFLIAGFILYAAIYAAIGSAVDNIQDAGQFQSFIIFPIIIGLVMSMAVINDPSSSMAMWGSFIPFTAPMVMMARIPFGIPAWEIWVSLAILVASFLAMVWIAAKIYRVGIFMYGKKPSVKELIRWINYK